MNIQRILIIIMITAAFTGCTTQSERLKRYISTIPNESSLEKLPKIGEIYSIEVGESLIYEQHAITREAIDVLQPCNFYTSNMGNNFSVQIQAGRYIATGSDQSGKFFVPASGSITINNDPSGSKSTTRGIYVSNENSDATEFYIISNTGRPLNYDTPKIILKRATDTKIDSTRFKKELVYTGISKNTITIVYREFNEGLARPAFTQEIKYDLSEGNIVGFRGARFEVISATNTGIKYKALNHLN